MTARFHRVSPGAAARALVLGLLAGGPALAAIFPSNNITFQTSGRQRPATIGDWYTSNDTNSTDRLHRFTIEITPAQLAAQGGSIAITVQDAESNAASATITDEVAGTQDPTRFSLRLGDGVTLASGVGTNPQTFPSGSPDGSTATFTVTTAGTYILTSETGATPISGTNTLTLNDDDNGFRISVGGSGGATGGGIGVFQGSFQQDTGSPLTVTLYFPVGPGTTSLALRNFDIDSCGGCTVTYTRPSGATSAGTVSGNGLWNGASPTVNTGQDTLSGLSTTTGGAADAGVWRYTLNNYSSGNQHSFEALNNLGQRLVAYDVSPQRAGLFTLTADGTLGVVPGSFVNHGFTVTNQYTTNDIINFTLSGTTAGYTVALYAADGTTLLTDTDGDGRVDTGILTPQQAKNFVLRVTASASVTTSDTTRISGVSFMDNKIVSSSNTTLAVDKTTVLAPRMTKAFSPSTIESGGQSTLTFTLSNTNSQPITGAAFTDVFPTSPGAMRVATPLFTTNTCGGTLLDSAGGGLAAADAGIRLSGGTIPASGSCTVSVRVTATASGTYTNTSGAVTSTSNGTGNTATANLVVQAVAPPSLSKSFSPNPLTPDGVATLTFTVTNPSATTTQTGITFTDVFPTSPAQMTVASPLAMSNTCNSGNLRDSSNNALAAGDVGIRMNGASLDPGESCTITIDVTAPASGSYVNTTNAISSSTGGTGNTATATLLMQSPMTVAKAFAPATVSLGSPSVMTITLSNPNASAMTGTGFTDSYPAGLVNAANPAAATTCVGGSVTAAAGGGSLSFANGTLPASGSCTVTVNVTRTTTGSVTNTIPAGGVSSNGIENTAAASASLTGTAITAPVVTKSFSPATIQSGGRSQLILTVSNNNTTATLTGVAFNDTYPANLVNDATPTTALTCTSGSSGNTTGGTAGGNTFNFNGGSLLAGGSCTISVFVTSSTVGTYNNSTTAVGYTNPFTGATATGGTAAATLTVQALPAPLKVTKSFATASTGVGTPTTMTLTITNPNTAGATAVGLTDTFPTTPGAMTLASATVTNTCGGSITDTNLIAGAPSVGDTGIRLNAGSLAAESSCTIVAQVAGNAEGTYTNTTSTVTALGLAAGPAASAQLTLARPTVAKAFSPASIARGGTSTITLTLSNPTATAFTAAAVTDNLPSGVTVASPPAASTNCGAATLTAVAGAGSFGISGGTIPANGSCTLNVNVTSATAGTYTNTIPASGLTSSGGSNAAAASAQLLVLQPPTISKTFTDSVARPNQPTTLVITLTNPNAVALTSATVTDTLPTSPAQMVTAGNAVTSCPVGTADETTTTVMLTGATIPANGSCNVSVDVSAPSVGSYTNTIAAGGLGSSGGSNAAAASAVLTIRNAPTGTKAFSPATVAPGGASTLTLTLSNPNTVAATATAFTDTYPAGLVNAATPAAATTCGGTVTATAGGGSLALAGGTIPANGSCTVSVRVTAAAAGSYVNTLAAGTIVTSNGESAADVSGTLSVLAAPTLTVFKLVSTYSDPVNGTSSPKALPGAVAAYTIGVSNSGVGTIDANTTVITDAIPANTRLFVGDLGGPGSGPVAFTQGPTSSGLTYTFTSLGSSADDLDFSNNGGATWTYTPVPVGGYDDAVTHIRVRPKGSFAAASGGNTPSFQLVFRVQVK